jgi:hypothetical protein
MAQDNWAHRSQGMRCGTCMWFVEKVTPKLGNRIDGELQAERQPFGRCRRHAPTMTGFPAVFASDWCGDHKLDETRL